MLKCLTRTKRSFGVFEKLSQVLGTAESRHMPLATQDPRMFENPFKVLSPAPSARNRMVSKLPNGVEVLTENTLIPGPVTLGVLLDVGSRDETKESSGVLHSIKATYYKSAMNTNETINYGMVQMSGGKYDMNYNREMSIFKASCLAHDVVDIFGMMSDCILEPRTFATANVAISKLPHSHKLHAAQQSHASQTDKILAACFGSKGLGMPYLGYEKNILNLNAQTLQKFQIENISPERIKIAAVGVENHAEFLELANNFFGNLTYGAGPAQREPAKFAETEIRAKNSQASKNEIVIVFESANWHSKDLLLNYFAKELFGSADVSNPDCKDLNRGLFSDEIYQKQKFVHSIESFNMHFTDAGLFGFRVQANADSTNKALEALAGVIKGLSKTSPELFEGARKRLKRRLVESLSKDFERVEELLKHQNVYKEIRIKQFLQAIDSISVQDVAQWAAGLGSRKMAFILEGSDVTNIHSHAKLKELFK